ncbi:MAG TPA: DUF6114 domain-containing protein [Trebonia sp.]|nr:DUF6114 domain-containing protein [Trebonia sp.]
MATGNPVKQAAQRLALPGDWRPTRPTFRGRGDHHKSSASKPARQASWRLTFRAWRQTRPFWGGLLLILGGLELLGIPLSGILSRGAVRLVVYIGIGGIFGVLIGILLIAAGVAIWVSPVHRVFYGIAGVVMGLASFPTSNLGGFFLCMLLAIIGGSIAVAWTPDPVRTPALAAASVPAGPAAASVPTEPAAASAPAEPATTEPAASVPTPLSPEAPTSPDLRPTAPADLTAGSGDLTAGSGGPAAGSAGPAAESGGPAAESGGPAADRSEPGEAPTEELPDDEAPEGRP